LGEAASGKEGIPVSVLVDGPGALPPEVHLALYRITQEALNNVVKHARARHAWVRLDCTDGDRAAAGRSMRLAIGDDGCGFDPAQVPPDRLGLGIMQERAQAIGASLTVASQPGQGTQVTVIWKPAREQEAL
jgi:signal transduction histidine kinase